MRFSYGPNVKPLAEWTEKILEKILELVGVIKAVVTSTVRTPEDQARIMFENFEAWHVLPNGPDKDSKNPRKLYKPKFGGVVIDVYDYQKMMGQPTDAVIHAMAQKIIELGPEKVSAHCTADLNKSIFDVAPTSIPDDKKKTFINQVTMTTGLVKFLRPPLDTAYHIEVKLV